MRWASIRVGSRAARTGTEVTIRIGRTVYLGSLKDGRFDRTVLPASTTEEQLFSDLGYPLLSAIRANFSVTAGDIFTITHPPHGRFMGSNVSAGERRLGITDARYTTKLGDDRVVMTFHYTDFDEPNEIEAPPEKAVRTVTTAAMPRFITPPPTGLCRPARSRIGPADPSRFWRHLHELCAQ